MTRIFVPKDAAALAVGADKAAARIAAEAHARGLPVEIVRTGSRGMFFLEPLIEVETAQGRVGYGPVSASSVASLFDAGLLTGGAHSLRIGKPEEHPFLAGQTRLAFARCGIVDPLSLSDNAAHDGWKGLKRALEIEHSAIVAEVTKSGLRGRGGAGFPTGIKWKTVADTSADRKYVVCNADEGDSGTFAERMIMEGDPFALIEGMTICGIGVGATKGYVYCRSEYPHAGKIFSEALRVAREAGYLGPDIQGSGHAFELELPMGAGAYICGEETSLLESLEGKRGIVRAKPPLPAHKGLFAKPMPWAFPCITRIQVRSWTRSRRRRRLLRVFPSQSFDELGSVQWPCNSAAPEGTPVMHIGAFARGKGKFVITEYVATDERTGARFPLLLTTGRILSHYNVGAQTRRTANVAWHEEDRLEIHPHDAEQRGVRDGDWVKVSSRAGETTLRALVTDRVAPGVVYTTFHHPSTQANVVTTDFSDWATNCPEYKVTAVQISRSNGPTDWRERYREQAERSRHIAETVEAE
jgi:formylmethanofuran dehydrogenase subunit D